VVAEKRRVAGERTERSRRFDELEREDEGFGLGCVFGLLGLHDDHEAFWIQDGLKNEQINGVAVCLALQCNECWVMEKFNNK